MSLKIVRNDITQMATEAIVNTANEFPEVGPGCDTAVYDAAGYEELLAYRKEHIGRVPEGEAFLTPGFRLPAKYIIHAVSPLYVDGDDGEEEKLRSCYQKSLRLAVENGIQSIAFPLISTGSFGYPKEEGMRIAVDEINAFLLAHDIEVYLVVFDEKAVQLGEKIYPDLEAYIDSNYVSERQWEEYGNGFIGSAQSSIFDEPLAPNASYGSVRESKRRSATRKVASGKRERRSAGDRGPLARLLPQKEECLPKAIEEIDAEDEFAPESAVEFDEDIALGFEFDDLHGDKIKERMAHLSDTFSEYLMYLIQDKGMTAPEVYKRAIVDKKVFNKIKNNPQKHPAKMTAMCLCMGAKLNMDETRDLLARAGYALSPCDKTDVIFSYFIENHIYDMIELDIQLEEHGLKCLIS